MDKDLDKLREKIEERVQELITRVKQVVIQAQGASSLFAGVIAVPRKFTFGGIIRVSIFVVGKEDQVLFSWDRDRYELFKYDQLDRDFAWYVTSIMMRYYETGWSIVPFQSVGKSILCQYKILGTTEELAPGLTKKDLWTGVHKSAPEVPRPGPLLGKTCPSCQSTNLTWAYSNPNSVEYGECVACISCMDTHEYDECPDVPHTEEPTSPKLRKMTGLTCPDCDCPHTTWYNEEAQIMYCPDCEDTMKVPDKVSPKPEPLNTGDLLGSISTGPFLPEDEPGKKISDTKEMSAPFNKDKNAFAKCPQCEGYSGMKALDTKDDSSMFFCFPCDKKFIMIDLAFIKVTPELNNEAPTIDVFKYPWQPGGKLVCQKCLGTSMNKSIIAQDVICMTCGQRYSVGLL